MNFRYYNSFPKIKIRPRFDIVYKYFDFTQLFYDPISKENIVTRMDHLDIIEARSFLEVRYLPEQKELKYKKTNKYTDYKFCIRILQLEFELFNEQHSHDLILIFKCLKIMSVDYKLSLFKNKNKFEFYEDKKDSINYKDSYYCQFYENNAWSIIDAKHWYVKRILELRLDSNNKDYQSEYAELKQNLEYIDKDLSIISLIKERDLKKNITSNLIFLKSILASRFRITNVYRKKIAMLLYDYLKLEVTKDLNISNAKIYVVIGYILARLDLIFDENKIPSNKLDKYPNYRDYLYQTVKSMI